MKKLITALSILCASFALQADYSDYYIMLSVCAPGQIPIAKSSIDGVRLHLIYGDVQNLNGLDLGIGCGRVRENMNGLQIAGGNVVGTDMAGAQLGFVNLVDSDMAGFQCSLWNDVRANGDGFQLGICNTAGDFDGLQLSLVNVADAFGGLQLGLVNWTGTMTGVQIGLLNFIDDERFLFVFPFVNGRF